MREYGFTKPSARWFKREDEIKAYEKALGDIAPPTAFKNAIRIMRDKPDLCNRISCWDETMWLIIEEFLNSGGQVREEDYLFQACALLET